MSVYRLSHAWIIGLLADANWRLRRVSVRISQDNYNIRRLYKRATKMASLSIPHSNFLFLGQGLKLCQFQYWSTHYQLRSMARYVTVLLSTTRKGLQGEQGWRSSESTRLPPVWPGFNSRRRRHMWVKFVVGSFPCSERFFSRYSGFPLSSKTNISKFQFDQESGRRRTAMWMFYLQIVIVIIIYYYY